MRESIHTYFQMGTILWMSYPNRPVLEAVKAIARDPFFDAIEITQNKDAESRAEEKKLLAQSHLRVCYGAQPRLLGPKLNPNAIDEEERKKAEKTLLEAIDEAEYFGAKGIAFLAGKWEEGTKDIAYRQLLKTTGNLCAYAATKGMQVELEVFDYDVDKAALVGPAPLAARFAADVRTRHSNFGLLVDLSHFPITHEDSHQVIGTCRPYITQCRRVWGPAPALRVPGQRERHGPAVGFLPRIEAERFPRQGAPVCALLRGEAMEG